MAENQSSGRKRYSPEEKFKIVKGQLTTKTSVSEICKKYGVSPGNFYNWQESFFNGAMAGFDKKRGPQPWSAHLKLMRSLRIENYITILATAS